MVVGVILSVQAVQLVQQSWRRPGFGVDFALLYTAAHVWGSGGDSYDDASLKAAWQANGDPNLPAPGRPITPNVYPLTLAPLVHPLTHLPFHAAILVWAAIVLASEGYLLLCILRAAGLGSGTPVRLIPLAVAIAVMMLSYPTRLNLASLNIAMIAGALAVFAILTPGRPLVSGLAFGLSMVKYSLVGPLALLFLWRRQYQIIIIAAIVQIALVALAGLGDGEGHPLAWVGAMKQEIDHSLAAGAINSFDAVAGRPMHLSLRSLWHSLAPGRDAWHWPILAAVLAWGVVALRRIPRDPSRWSRSSHASASSGAGAIHGCPHPKEPRASARAALPVRCLSDAPMVAAILAITLVAFYHRAYDLVPVMALTAAWLVRPADANPRRPWWEWAVWGALLLTVLPGLWSGWDAATNPYWVRLLVQPACAWAALALAGLMPIALMGSRRGDDVGARFSS